MPLYCNDADLLIHEPALFAEPALAHFRRLVNVHSSLDGTTLTLTDGSFTAAWIFPGMVATLSLADDTAGIHCEIVAVTSATTATISTLRPAAGDSPIAPPLTGAVIVQVTSFAPQIAAVGDKLLAALGIAVDPATSAPTTAVADLLGFRPAAVFGTLAALYRTLLSIKDTFPQTQAKLQFYTAAFAALSRQLAATVDLDGDGAPETPLQTGITQLYRA